MHIDVGLTPFISCANFLQKTEYNCVRLLLEGLFGHGGVIQHILVVTIHVCGIPDRNSHNPELAPKTTDIFAGLLHCNQLNIVRTGLARYLIIRYPNIGALLRNDTSPDL